MPPRSPRGAAADLIDISFINETANDGVRLLSPSREPSREFEPLKPKEKTSARTEDTPAAPRGGATKILFLDGLRGLAAMGVIVQHAKWLGDRPLGQPAVDVFFVLSAFLLTLIFERKARTLLQQDASYERWALALLDYFARRFLRVYPLFVIVAVIVACHPPADRAKLFAVRPPEDYSVVRVLLFDFKSRYHVFWTLPLEITYYFIIPALVIFLLKLHKFWFVPMLPLAYLVLYSGFYWFRLDHQPLTPHLPTFLCGSMAAIVYAKADQWIARNGFVFHWYHEVGLRTIECVCLALLFSTVFGGLFFDWVLANPIPQGPGGHFVSATVSVILVCEMLLPGAVASVLEWSLLRYAGKISFSMYMLHSFVVYSDWVQNQPSYYNKFFAIWGLSFAVGSVSYHLVESPCQWLASEVGKAIKEKESALEQRRVKLTLPVGSGHAPQNHTV
jgi:peptidoglycan/LPS O-acetylase OafA/YrhL